MLDNVVLIMPTRLEYLHLAASTVKGLCQHFNQDGAGEEFSYSVELAVSEACTNAIKHCRAGGCERPLELTFELSDAKIVVIIKHKGVQFDFDNAPLPQFDIHPEGGYGIYLIKEIMDQVEYSRVDGCNVIKMTKFAGKDIVGKGEDIDL